MMRFFVSYNQKLLETKRQILYSGTASPKKKKEFYILRFWHGILAVKVSAVYSKRIVFTVSIKVSPKQSSLSYGSLEAKLFLVLEGNASKCRQHAFSLLK